MPRATPNLHQPQSNPSPAATPTLSQPQLCLNTKSALPRPSPLIQALRQQQATLAKDPIRTLILTQPQLSPHLLPPKFYPICWTGCSQDLSNRPIIQIFISLISRMNTNLPTAVRLQRPHCSPHTWTLGHLHMQITRRWR